MPPAGQRGFPAHFDQGAWAEDLARTTPVGRQAAEAARREYERNGIPFEHMRRVQDQGHDGTVLANCAKVYLPPPAGRFGMVFRAIRVDGRPHLAYLAFGVRHQPHDSREVARKLVEVWLAVPPVLSALVGSVRGANQVR